MTEVPPANQPKEIRRWCPVCGTPFETRNVPSLNVNPAFCSEACWRGGQEQLNNLATWHPNALKNDMAAAIVG